MDPSSWDAARRDSLRHVRRMSNWTAAVLIAGPGAGLVAVLPRGRLRLRETAWVVRYLAGESAGQCGPCRFGLPAIADQVERRRPAVPARRRPHQHVLGWYAFPPAAWHRAAPAA